MTTLLSAFRGIVCDLDGVVYRGHEPVEHAVEALSAARSAGVGIVYATNNAARPPQDVATQLSSFGLDLEAADVVTSSQAGAAEVARRLPAGSPVLAVGGQGVRLALEEAGLRVVDAAAHASGTHVDGVLQGLGHDVSWRDLAEAAHAINSGATWVATNGDLTLPTERGIAPGNGSLVGVVQNAVEVRPFFVGKPETPLYDYARDNLGTEPAQTLAIGDRLDTDVVGANRAGIAALYVATGVSSVTDVALATGEYRPRYLVADLRGLAEEYIDPEITRTEDRVVAQCAQARVAIGGGGVDTAGEGAREHRMRALVAAVWAAVDNGATLTSDDLVDAARWVEAGTSGVAR